MKAICLATLACLICLGKIQAQTVKIIHPDISIRVLTADTALMIPAAVKQQWQKTRTTLPTKNNTHWLITGADAVTAANTSRWLAAKNQKNAVKVSLGTIAGQYAGEAEKNLDRIFADAAVSKSVLWFDEADALFGKRTGVKDSHDRYANAVTNYLLQKMEAYEGMVLLTSNCKDCLDTELPKYFTHIIL